MSSIPQSSNLIKSREVGVENFMLLVVLSVILGIAYSFITFFINFDPILIGPIALVGIAIYLPTYLIVLKKKVRNYSRLIIIGLLSVFLAFTARFATSAYLSYEEMIKTTIEYTKTQGTFNNENEVRILVNDFLKFETGSEGYIGALILDMQNMSIQSSRSGSSSEEVGFIGALGLNIVELVAALLFIGFAMPNDLKKMIVICASCDEIKTNKSYTIGKFKDFEKIKKALLEKDLVSLKSFLKSSEVDKNDFSNLVFYECPQCGIKSSSNEVNLVARKNQQKKDVGKRIIYTQEELKELLKTVSSSVQV